MCCYGVIINDRCCKFVHTIYYVNLMVVIKAVLYISYAQADVERLILCRTPV